MPHWTLVRQDTNLPVKPGDTVFDFRGEAFVLMGGRPPQHAASTGRVWLEGGGEYFPSVFGLAWQRSTHHAAPIPHARECA